MRKLIFWMHLIIGCSAAAIVLIMAVTGVMLAYERQVMSWVDHDFRSHPLTPASTPIPMEALLASVIAQNGGLPSSVAIRSDHTAPAEVSFGREHVFLVDLYTGTVLGESSPVTRSLFQRVENWHRWLGASSDNRALGRGATGVCNAGFLFLVLSGPFLWLPRKWSWQNVRAVLTLRRGLSGRARDFNWHNVIGIWCSVPLSVIVLSGVIMSFPWANNLLYRVTGNEPPVQRGEGQRPTPRRESGHAEDQPALKGSDASWNRAKQQDPGWQSITLRLSPSGRGPLAFTIDTGNGGRPDQRSQLTVNPRTGEVIRYEPFSSYNAGRRLRSWFRFLHTGEAGGIAGQSIAALASAGAAILAWTGLWLAARRFLRWRSRRRQAGTGSSVAAEPVISTP